MDKSENNFTEETIHFMADGQPKSKKNSKRIFIAVFLFLIFVILAGYWIWFYYYSPYAVIGQNVRKYERAIKQMEEDLKADIYGGKTPEQTLQMFVEALTKEDIELASKYFALGGPLSREEWKQKIKKETKELIDIVSRAVPTSGQEPSERSFWFSVYDNKGETEQLIEMFFNTWSGVWKIQSL